MMNNTCKKATLFSVILTIILAAAIVIGAIFGFNGSATMSDKKLLTVSMNQFAYETQMDEVKTECEKAFGAAKAAYEIHGEMSGDESEIIFIFNSDVDVDSIAKNLSKTFADLTKEGAAWYGTHIKVMANTDKTLQNVTEGYVLRAVIASVVFAVLAFVYVAIRYKWHNGVIAALAIVFTVSTTAGLLLFARVPVAASTMYAVVISALYAAVVSVMNIHKENAAKKEILFTCGVSAAAVVLVGCVAGMANVWFAVSAVIGLAVATVLGLFYVPALSVALQPIADAQEAAKDKFAYKGAQKTSSKEKKSAPAPVVEEEKSCGCCDKCHNEEPVEEATEEPVEEAVEEVTEEPVEETIEEVTEEPVEEAVEEVAEQPVEEAVEEVAEQPVEEVVETETAEETEEVKED